MERILSIKEKMHLAFFPTTQKHIISREALCFDKSVVQNTPLTFFLLLPTQRGGGGVEQQEVVFASKKCGGYVLRL